MRFMLNKVSSTNVRLGQLTDFPRLPGKVFESPLLLMYTRGGSIPHITHEVLQYLTKEQQCMMVNLPSSVQMFDSLQEYKEGIAKFSGLEEYISFCTVQDPGVKTLEGYNSKNEISVWSYAGRVTLTPDKFMKIMEAYKPDVYEVLGDSDTNMESSQKRCRKSVEVSLGMFDKCMERHKSSSILSKRGVLASVTGGHSLDFRKLCAEYVGKNPDVTGYILNGLHNNGPQVMETDLSVIKPVIEHILKYLPEDKLKMLPGCWKPQHVIELLEMGIDVFDSSLPFAVTQRNSALVFSYSVESSENEDGSCTNGSSSPLEISLENEKFAEDFGPILKECTCLTCVKHTRAYIHHLINVKELLSSTLLMIHNLHHYMEFFKFIRKASTENKKVVIS